jgi:hypothetical protein
MKDYFATVAQNSEPTAQHGVILRSFELADAAYRRVKREAGKLPNDGYGVVGVCNDPTQYIETQLLAEFGGILMPGVKNPHYSKYPLLRSRTLEVASDLKDPFESIIKAMPFDIPLGVNEAGAVPTEDEVGIRLLRSAPDAWKQSEFWDKRLQRDLLAIFNRLFKK